MTLIKGRQLSGMAAVLLALLLMNASLLGQSYGEVKYRPDGLEVAQPYFGKGLLLLHNFQYSEAAKQFQMAQLLDPDMYMAYWGEALCYDQAIWYKHDTEKARGVLFKMGVSMDKRLAKIENELERGFLNSVEELFREEGTYEDRYLEYQRVLEALHKKYPNNVEATTFLALSYLTLYPYTKDKEQVERAHQLLQLALEVEPGHPGALNYLINASDHPNRAYRARQAVVDYPAVTAGLFYSQHVISHYYLALGQWSAFTESNTTAWKMEEAFAKKAKINLEDAGYHSFWWQLYGRLQLGQYTKAAEMVKDMNFYAQYSKKTAIRYHLAMMRAAFLVETEQWDHAIAEIEVRASGFDVNMTTLLFYVEGLQALAEDNLQKTEWFILQIADQRMLQNKEIAGMDGYHCCHGQAAHLPYREPVNQRMAEQMELTLRALYTFRSGGQSAAFRLIDQAVAIKKELPYFPAPPLVIKPVHEIYGEMLLKAGKYSEALLQFDLALAGAPNRTRSVVGKYQAYKMSGNTAGAAEMKKIIDKNWIDADPEVKAGL